MSPSYEDLKSKQADLIRKALEGSVFTPSETVVFEGGQVNTYDPIEWELKVDPIWQGVLARTQDVIDRIEKELSHPC